MELEESTYLTSGSTNYCFNGGMCLGTIWMKLCACESAVARESKVERESFEMMLNVEKDPAVQKAGRKTF